MSDAVRGAGTRAQHTPERQDGIVLAARCFSWVLVALMCAFLANNYLTNWRDWPGSDSIFGGATGFAVHGWVQASLYPLFAALAIAGVLRTPQRSLRSESETMYAITAYIIRASFWAVFLIGLADFTVSFLRVENLLPVLFGDQTAVSLGRSSFRGVYVHFPMLALGALIALWYRGLAFPWLALLVVAAELLIVISRFIFSYEQAFMADLVRFWYAALFLFASAYTLLEEGHVRVDVLYSAFAERTKGMVNAVGSILLGLPMCVIIMAYGMDGKSTVINGPLLIFETTQTTSGMFVKYWMAGFLGIFAISMFIQFAGYFLEGIADWRGDPGKRPMDMEIAAAG